MPRFRLAVCDHDINSTILRVRRIVHDNATTRCCWAIVISNLSCSSELANMTNVKGGRRDVVTVKPSAMDRRSIEEAAQTTYLDREPTRD